MLNKAGKIAKDVLFRNKLNQLIFFITSSCNSSCRHCFYWKNLNKTTDLKLEEINKMSLSLPAFNDLLLSGGEPFLRQDLAEVISIFRKNNKIKTVSIPTNGILQKVIVREVLRISKNNPELLIYLNFSLDGLTNFHDQMRGKKGVFKSAIKTIKEICNEKRNNGLVTITTVVSPNNLKELVPLMKYINSLKEPRILHYFEILRGNPKESSLAKKISISEWEKAYADILKYQEKRFADFYNNSLKTKLAIKHLRSFYKIQKRSYFNEKWPMKCVAGRNIFVIDANGDIRACELRKKIANVKNLDNFKNVFKEEREKILSEKCSCTHACFLYQSIHYAPWVVFK